MRLQIKIPHKSSLLFLAVVVAWVTPPQGLLPEITSPAGRGKLEEVAKLLANNDRDVGG